MTSHTVNKIRVKSPSTLTKVERGGKVTIYENNRIVSEIRSATSSPLHEQEASHLIKRK